MPSDFKIKVNFPTGEIIQVGINVRPFAREILAALSKNFEVIVFTASHSCYANVVLDNLDPERKYIQHRLFR
jgi:CTD small phosphatase-like protein 2